MHGELYSLQKAAIPGNFISKHKIFFISNSTTASHMLRRIHVSHCLIQQSIDEGHRIIRALPIACKCMDMIYFLFIFAQYFFSQSGYVKNGIL